MKSTLFVVSLALVAAFAAAQTCPCSFAPNAASPVVVLDTPGTPDTCRVETRISGGCFCVSGTGDAGVCNIDSSAVVYQFIGSGPQCQAVANPVAICPPASSVTRTCSIDANVAWQLNCLIERSAFPDGVAISGIRMAIKQTDNFTFTGTGNSGNAYTIEYRTENTILPATAFPTWPSTPLKSDSGSIPAGGTVVFTDASDIPVVTLDAQAAGLSYAQALYDANDDVVFQLRTAIDGASSGFLTTEFFPVFSSAVVTLTATYA